jgi:hypothetical protein
MASSSVEEMVRILCYLLVQTSMDTLHIHLMFIQVYS